MKRTSAACLVLFLGCLITANAQAEAPVATSDAAEAMDACADRFYLRAEYLLWWLQPTRLPALVTTGSPLDATPGALGQPGTRVLIGDESVSTQEHDGGRVTFGYWLTAQHDFAVEGRYFFLGSQSRSFLASSNGSLLLARPFPNADTNEPAAAIVASPGASGFIPEARGDVGVTLRDHLQGGEADARAIGWSGPGYQVDLVGGFRFIAFDEKLDINESTTALAVGITTSVGDHFAARNRFYGGQLGLAGDWQSGPWLLDVRGTIGLGVMDEQVDVGGVTSTTTAAGIVSAPHGLLAQAGNSGRRSRSVFAAVPEVGVNVGRQLTRHVAGFVGYTFLYSSSVARPGDQIDRSISPAPVSATGGRPAAPVHEADLWVQGLNLGLELRY
jgi:hypothetical protein